MNRKLRVLVVEDEIYTARNLCAELEELDIDALNPEITGEIAVERAVIENPDLIIMDIRLAGEMDGLEAAKIIKEKCRIPIVFITGYPAEYLKERAKEVDCLEFFEKPIMIDELIPILDILKKNLKKKNSYFVPT